MMLSVMRKFLLLALCAAVCGLRAAPIQIDVTGVLRQSLSLDGVTASGQAGQLYLDVLRNDLLRSGWYRMAPNGQVRVTGSLSGSGTANANLTVSWPGKRFVWPRTANADAVRRQAHELADAIVSNTIGETGMACSRIAMVYRAPQKRNGQNIDDLYVMDYDGHNLRRLTRDGVAIVGPRWSCDGQYIYFTSYRLGYPAVFRVDMQGNMLRLADFRGLSTGAVPSPTDPDSIAIILSHQGNPELYILNARTRALTRLTTTAQAAEASPCWSPDGRRICYVSDVAGSPQLYIVDVATKQSRRLTLRGGENVQPDWGKNGIVFATRRGWPYRIAVIDPDRGESSLRYLTPVNEQYESPSWAPDGRHVVTSRKQGSSQSIWILDADEKGAAPYQAFRGSGQWLNPAWSR